MARRLQSPATPQRVGESDADRIREFFTGGMPPVKPCFSNIPSGSKLGVASAGWILSHPLAQFSGRGPPGAARQWVSPYLIQWLIAIIPGDHVMSKRVD